MVRSVLIGAVLAALSMNATAASQECALSGLSADIAKRAASLPATKAWESKVNGMLAFYYPGKAPRMQDATCPNAPYLKLAARLAMASNIIAAQAVMEDIPATARKGELYVGLERLITEATLPDHDSAEMLEIYALAEKLVKRAGARTPQEQRYVETVIRSGMYDDKLGLEAGIEQLRRLSAAPSVIASARQSAKAVRERVLAMSEEGYH
jgi:hypothetical protein